MRTARRGSTLVLGVVLMVLASLAPQSAALAISQQEPAYHTVQAGDTWLGIAAQYSTPVSILWRANGVVNPDLLQEGQRLLIPSPGEAARETLTFEIGPDYSVWKAALLSGNTLGGVLYLSGFTSPTLAWAQVLAVSVGEAGVAQAASTPTPAADASPTPAAPSESPTLPPASEGALHRSLLGVQGHFSVPREELRNLLDRVAYGMEFRWVKVQVDWSLTEYAPGQYSIELDKLDTFVDEAFNRELSILLSVVKAPDWARATTDEDGPPTDYNRYYDFLRFLAGRYPGKVDAIEVWNEPNLRREWNGGTLSGAEYVSLLAGAYTTIKEVNGAITVVSAGLAPTGVNNEIAVNDRLYFRQMYEAGLSDHTDVIGIHPYGWANPPWARCCGDSGGVPSHNDDPSFFFANTVEDYHAIQLEFGDTDHKLWATEFGWGTVDGLGVPVPDEQPFFGYLNQDLQARYILEAFMMAQQWDFMGPMFLWNLNVATLDGHIDVNQAGYSILIDVDRPRNAYRTLRDAPKVDQ